MNVVEKSTLVALLVLFSVAVVGTHQYGLFPIVLLFAFISILLIVGGYFLSPVRLNTGLASIIGVAIVYRLIIFFYPSTLIGIDTDKKAYWTSELVRLGSTDGISSSFYQVSPLYNIYSGIVVEIADISSSDSFAIFPLLVGLLIPLTVALLVRTITNDEYCTPAIIAASIAAVSTAVLQQSYWPVAQTYSLLVWCVFLISTIRYIDTRSREYFTILLISIIGLVFSHKLPVIMVLGVLGAAALVTYLTEVKNEGSAYKEAFSAYGQITQSVALISGLVLFLHWGYLSNYIDDVMRRLAILIISGSTTGPSSPTQPTAVEAVNPGLIGRFINYPNHLSLFFERSHAVILLIASGCCWSYWIYKKYNNNGFNTAAASIILGGAASGVALTSIGVISIGTLNPNRPLMMIEPLLAVLIAGAIYKLLDYRKEMTHFLGVSIVVLLVFTQIFTAPAIPDYPNTPRYYLSADEVEGRSFGCEYIDEEIGSDYYVHQEIYANDEYCDQYVPIDRYTDKQPLFNNRLDEVEQNHIGYRPGVDVYLGTHSRWRLTYDPATQLSDRNKTYDSGGFHIFN